MTLEAKTAETQGQAYEPAARQALAMFGVEPADLRFINLSENVTFRAIDSRGGSPLVLRLHRPGYHDIVALRSEHMWIRALVQAGIPAPEPLLTPAGESFARVEITATGEQRWAGLARWAEGELLADVVARETDAAANTAYFEKVGAIMAAMHDQAIGWTPPADFQRHMLDADGLMGAKPFWGPFWDQAMLSPAERGMLLKTRDRLHAALTRYGKSIRTFSMIHADLHPYNVLIDGARMAVIDFDDSGFGWHQYDLAAAIATHQDRPDFAMIRDACIVGYRSVRSISDEDLTLLPMFLLIRDMAHLGWYHQRPELRRSSVLSRANERACSRAAGFEPPI
ncbi:MAG: phosphotransferase [Alphaproteobacteria bacterium]|nr:phosphotransferase [Alphaproteobacteria bacterium]